uniref:Uncharacterized protein n=1 Tax=Magnetococcus massalia (strain MO-1) TaxID=451514 RepID=A0A1S7LE73_MAGMO|nr:Exported protein of unknown function [Candidatus Magnetococcus massalia]
MRRQKRYGLRWRYIGLLTLVLLWPESGASQSINLHQGQAGGDPLSWRAMWDGEDADNLSTTEVTLIPDRYLLGVMHPQPYAAQPWYSERGQHAAPWQNVAEEYKRASSLQGRIGQLLKHHLGREVQTQQRVEQGGQRAVIQSQWSAKRPLHLELRPDQQTHASMQRRGVDLHGVASVRKGTYLGADWQRGRWQLRSAVGDVDGTSYRLTSHYQLSASTQVKTRMDDEDERIMLHYSPSFAFLK